MLDIVRRHDINLRGDERRVLTRIFIPGEEELIRGTSRAKEMVHRVLDLTEAEVAAELQRTFTLFGHRHNDLEQQFESHFAAVSGVVDIDTEITNERMLLIGSYLTQEYAYESTAYFNPSIVEHPDQSGMPPGSLRFLMSIRAVGEGHISTLVFRSGVIDNDGQITVDDPAPNPTTRANRYSVLRNRLVQQCALEAGIDAADLQFILGMLPEKFTPEELSASLSQANVIGEGPEHLELLSSTMQDIAKNSYEIDFAHSTHITERVIWPTAHDERRGIEDARFVRFRDTGVASDYRATYTGFNGTQVVTRMLETDDFRTFSSMGLSGKAVRNKGLALFPRMIKGRHCAVSRWDRESNSVAWSDDGYHWNEVESFHVAAHPWDLIHVGNCGSPIEIDEGWLLLTHGTGPMRRYTISAMLLDKDEPSRTLRVLREPLIEPLEDEREGYVPNVVYSCGSLIHNDRLVMPYGYSDTGTKFASVDVNDLLSAMEPVKTR